jgi:protein SCO1/2
MTRPSAIAQLLLVGALLCSAPISLDAQLQPSAPVQTIGIRPSLLRDVGLDQRLGEQLPLNLSFRDENGKRAALSQYFEKKPVILSLVYYDCPMLCTQVLSGLITSMKQISLNAGKDFTVITLSIDPSEKPELARAKHEVYTGIYDRPGAVEGWHFLTGDEPEIKQLAAAAGFRYAYDPATRQFAHASGIMVATPEGRLTRYLYGVNYSPRDLRLSLVEAAENRIGTTVDQILLYCYHYDPATGRYGFVIARIIKLAGVLTTIALAALVGLLLRRERVHARNWDLEGRA